MYLLKSQVEERMKIVRTFNAASSSQILTCIWCPSWQYYSALAQAKIDCPPLPSRQLEEPEDRRLEILCDVLVPFVVI